MITIKFNKRDFFVGFCIELSLNLHHFKIIAPEVQNFRFFHTPQ